MTEQNNIKDYLNQTKVNLLSYSGAASLGGMLTSYAMHEPDALMLTSALFIGTNVMKGIEYLIAYSNMQSDHYNNKTGE